MAKLESVFQREVVKEIRELLPGCEILKNDASYLQGVPDILVLYYSRYGFLEFKRASNSSYQPNQSYYLDKFNSWSFAAMIEPSNKKEVLRDLQQALRPRR